MGSNELVSLYGSDSLVQTLAEGMATPQQQVVHLQHLHGSMPAVMLAAIYQRVDSLHLVVLHDKEEAAYFLDDLTHLLPASDLLAFPMSYRKPYEYEEVDNANILLRTEALNVLSSSPARKIVVTYPEALGEKVVRKKSLVSHTMGVRRGDAVDRAFLEGYLHEYGFEKVDFVYECGQFAVRGGIVDVFSFAHEMPVRIEFFGNTVDGIRSFNPGSQLLVEEMDAVQLMPDVHTHVEQADRQSLLEFIPANTVVWCKDAMLVHDVVEKSFTMAVEKYGAQEENEGTGKPGLVTHPQYLYDEPSLFASLLQRYSRVEFGSRYYAEPQYTFSFPSAAQPTFKKNFELLANDLLQYQQKGYRNFIATNQPKQAERLQDIFLEIHPEVSFEVLPFSLSNGFADHTLKLVCYTDHQIFERFHRYKKKERFSKSKAISLKELRVLKPGDFVTHIDHGIGKFAGLEKKIVNDHEQEAIRLVYRDDDLLYVSIHALHKISWYAGSEGTAPTISKLGSNEWENKKSRVKKKVKDIARELIQLYAKRKQAPGFAFAEDDFMQAELESSFLYEDTPDQAKATDDVKRDMQSPHPMDRLVCGDVGFGKTEVAIRAALKAVLSGKQVAVLVPTTILAFQHFRTFAERLAPFPVSVDYFSRFKSTKDANAILKRVESGKLDIIIGTHRVVNKRVVFKDLGLLIVDEEQKFGVKIKDRLKELKVNIDVLTLTATPIPRTLHFSLMGARDLSIIATPPPNRQPVTTSLHVFNEPLIRDAISAEIQRGGQVFFVHNRIMDIDQIANIIYRLVPDSRIGVAHGQMDGTRLEKVMLRFMEGEYDVLVSTNIIESGLDIPNANTIIINHAHMFGMSDLHQMRGRVGRSNTKASCYLLAPPTIGLSADAQKRLVALEEFSDLGDGIKVAMRDLDIRGAGNLLGAEQSGFINDLGFDAYHRILDEAVTELKETDFRQLFEDELRKKASHFVPECNVETDLDIIIPETYVANVPERLQLYAKLDNIKDEQGLTLFKDALRDRFGPVPEPVEQLMDLVRLRWAGERLGMVKLALKRGRVRAQFVSENQTFINSSVFGNILQFVQKTPLACKLHEVKGKCTLTIEDIDSCDAALKVLGPLGSLPE